MTKRSCKSCSLSESAPFRAIGADSICIGCRSKKESDCLEKGGICPECDVGELEDIREGSCYCAVTSFPPCGHCTTLELNCDNCDEVFYDSF